MISWADDDTFRSGLALLDKGVPYECIFGKPKLWSRNMRNAAIMVFNDFAGANEDDLE